jgi:hypothetical protein
LQPWEFDRLLQEVSQALQAEADAREMEEGSGNVVAVGVGSPIGVI